MKFAEWDVRDGLDEIYNEGPGGPIAAFVDYHGAADATRSAEVSVSSLCSDIRDLFKDREFAGWVWCDGDDVAIVHNHDDADDVMLAAASELASEDATRVLVSLTVLTDAVEALDDQEHVTVHVENGRPLFLEGEGEDTVGVAPIGDPDDRDVPTAPAAEEGST